MTDTKNAPVPGCETKEIHPDILKRVQSVLPEDTDLNRLAELYKVFGDTTRIKLSMRSRRPSFAYATLRNYLALRFPPYRTSYGF